MIDKNRHSECSDKIKLNVHTCRLWQGEFPNLNFLNPLANRFHRSEGVKSEEWVYTLRI